MMSNSNSTNDRYEYILNSDLPEDVRKLMEEADTWFSDAEMTQKLVSKHGRSVIREIVEALKKLGYIAD